MLARLVAALIVGFARALTGARAQWDAPADPAPTIYVVNHRSHGDFVLLWSALPPALRRRTRPVAGADYWLASAARRFVARKVFRALMIDRLRSGDGPDPVEQMAQVLRDGESLILFPEGTRNVSEAPLLPLKSGIWRLAVAVPQARCVPVWIDNLGRVLPKGEFVPVPLACTVHFGAPLPAATLAAGAGAEGREPFLAALRDALLALRPPHDRAPEDG